MRFTFAFLLLGLTASVVEGFSPSTTFINSRNAARISASITLNRMAMEDDNDDNKNGSESDSRSLYNVQKNKAMSLVAGSIVTLSVLAVPGFSSSLAADSVPPPADVPVLTGNYATTKSFTQPKSQKSSSSPSSPAPPKPGSTPISSVVPAKKAPISPEKKVLNTALTASETASGRYATAVRALAASRQADEKAVVSLKKAETAAKSTKNAYLDANDKLSQLRAAGSNTKAIVAQQTKVADASEASKKAVSDLTKAKLTKKQTSAAVDSAKSILQGAEKAKKSTAENLKKAEVKYKEYTKKAAEAEKKAAAKAKEDAAKKKILAEEQLKKKQAAEAKAKKEQAEKDAKAAKIKAEKIKEMQKKVKELEAAKKRAADDKRASSKEIADANARLQQQLKEMEFLQKSK